MKRIKVEEHALERAYQRNIGDAQIKECIENPDTKCPDKDGHGRIRVEKDFSGKRLRVIYKESQHFYHVVTAMWV